MEANRQTCNPLPISLEFMLHLAEDHNVYNLHLHQNFCLEEFLSSKSFSYIKFLEQSFEERRIKD